MRSRKDNTDSSQWALLPHDLLHEITCRLDKPSDYVRFGAVCKGWLSFAHKSSKQKHLLHIFQNNPLLLQWGHDLHSVKEDVVYDLYSVTKDVVYDQFQLQLPSKRCCGSSYGWLFFVEKMNESTLELVLINPFLGDSAKIKLPPIKFCSEDTVHMMDHYGVLKAILSKDPSVYPHDYEVVVLYGTSAKLAHYKSGNKFWSYAKKIEMKWMILTDVIFYKNLIFAVDRYGFILNFTFEPIIGKIQSTNYSPWYLEWNTIGEQLPLEQPFGDTKSYLVENSRGDLLFAQRFSYKMRPILFQIIRGSRRPNFITCFDVYRLCLPTSGEQVTVNKLRMRTLDGETLFLGDNNSISVPASKYPGLHSDSIYYNYPMNLRFCGIFHIQSGRHKFVPWFFTKGMPPPIFVVSQ